MPDRPHGTARKVVVVEVEVEDVEARMERVEAEGTVLTDLEANFGTAVNPSTARTSASTEGTAVMECSHRHRASILRSTVKVVCQVYRLELT